MESWRAVAVPTLPGRGRSPRVVDTATGELVPAAAGRHASLYACGITPYDATHLGHAATYLAWDLLVRAWRDAGHEVTYVQNVTDVDDPLLERAARDGDDWRALANREIARYRRDMEALRVLPPDHLVGAVEALPVIERFARLLADRGALYDLEDDQYFARASDPGFGAVSRLDPATMIALSAERGGDPGRPGKKDPLDVLVWIAARPGEPSWESGFGSGRPGWHVECTAIATEHLGPVFDVQAGGSDLIFPHHEMSASHARAGLGDPGAFARRYVHAGMVRLDGQKMSKSLGNLVFVSGLLADGADPMAVRLAILAHRFRYDWDWTAEGLASATARLARWRAAMARAMAVPGPGNGASAGAASAVPGGGAADAGAASAVPGVDSAVPGVGSVIPGAGSAIPGAGSAIPGVGSAIPGVGSPLPRGGSADAGAGSVVPGVGSAVSGEGSAVPSAESVLARVRERIADDLDAPGALLAVDDWADAVARAPALPAGSAAAAALVRDTVDALLGIAL